MHPALKLAIAVAFAGTMDRAGSLQGAQAAAESPREVREIAEGWQFQIDAHDQGERERWFEPGHDRGDWSKVEVPRAWDTFDESLRGFEGIGWFAVRLDASWAREGKLQRLSFGRVMYHARVWLNGEFLGEHIDGYLPFSFDITGKLARPANLLVLRVDNRPRIDWLPAAKQIEWVQYGGILQPVRVESRNKIAIDDLTIKATPKEKGANVVCSVEVVGKEEAHAVLLRASVRGQEQDCDARRPTGLAHLVTRLLSLWTPSNPGRPRRRCSRN